MICPKCYGNSIHPPGHNFFVVWCDRCGGFGTVHCCEGDLDRRAGEKDEPDATDQESAAR